MTQMKGTEVEPFRETSGFNQLVELILSDDEWSDDRTDVLAKRPDMTVEEAYEVQFEVMRRRVNEGGERIVGYKAANTSNSVNASLSGHPAPMIGTLLQSHSYHDFAEYSVRPGRTFVEQEIAVVLGSDLSGPYVNQVDVARATAMVCPAIEIASWSPAAVAGNRSVQHLIAGLKCTGLVIVGPGTPLQDLPSLRLEGAVLEVDGEAVGSGTGVEVMGNPLGVVAAIARTLSGYGLGLEAGMIIMTGAINWFVVPEGATSASAEFTTLGRVSARFNTMN